MKNRSPIIQLLIKQKLAITCFIILKFILIYVGLLTIFCFYICHCVTVLFKSYQDVDWALVWELFQNKPRHDELAEYILMKVRKHDMFFEHDYEVSSLVFDAKYSEELYQLRSHLVPFADIYYGIIDSIYLIFMTIIKIICFFNQFIFSFFSILFYDLNIINEQYSSEFLSFENVTIIYKGFANQMLDFINNKFLPNFYVFRWDTLKYMIECLLSFSHWIVFDLLKWPQ